MKESKKKKKKYNNNENKKKKAEKHNTIPSYTSLEHKKIKKKSKSASCGHRTLDLGLTASYTITWTTQADCS